MIDPNTYAQLILADNPSEEYQGVVESLEMMTELVHQKGKVLQTLGPDKFLQLFKDSLPGGSKFIEILQIIHKNGDLKLLPRINISFRRHLNQKGYTVVEVSAPQDFTNVDDIKSQFGQDTIVISNYDPTLIAGARLTTIKGTYEYSLDLMLNRLGQTLAD